MWPGKVASPRTVTNEISSPLGYGVTVEQGVLAYEQEEYMALKRGGAWVVDGRGSTVGPGGTLENGARLYIRHSGDEPPEP